MRRLAQTRRSIAGHVLRHLVLIAGLVIMLTPFVWMVSTSLKPPNEIFSTKLRLLPEQLGGRPRTTPRPSPRCRCCATC